MRRRKSRIERLRFRVFDDRAREALREMAAAHGPWWSGPPPLPEEGLGDLEARIVAAIAGAEPLSSPLSSFVLERTGKGLSLRQFQAGPDAESASSLPAPSGRDAAPEARRDRAAAPREITLFELDLPRP